MRFTYWIKFEGNPRPEKFTYSNIDALWHDIREMMLRDFPRYGIIEWMIRGYD